MPLTLYDFLVCYTRHIIQLVANQFMLRIIRGREINLSPYGNT